MDPSQQAVQDAYQQLYDSLTDAYWAASTIEDKDRIRGAADVVFEIISQLTVADIKSRSADFTELKTAVNSVTEKLRKLQSEIDTIVHNIEIASKVAAGIAKALELGGKFLA